MPAVLLSLGSNLEDRADAIQKMENALKSILEAPFKKSGIMETEPVGVGNQRWFLNEIFLGQFFGSPEALLEHTQEIERSLGRDKKNMRAPRTADIDILLFGEWQIESSELSVPHPEMLRRRFCLEGAYQIAPDWIIPGTGKSIRDHYKSMEPGIVAQQIHFLE